MNSKKPNPVRLTPKDVEGLNILVLQAEPGKYTLRQLHGEDAWQHVRRKQALGLWFKAAVAKGRIPGIRCAGKRSDKAQLYEVLPRANELARLTNKAEAFA